MPERRTDAVETPPPSPAQDILRLQSTVGNQAVGRLLGKRGAPRLGIQRSPSTWVRDQRVQTVLALKKGGGLTSRWPKIVKLTPR